DDHATEINRKLQEIIQRENLKKQQALQTIRGQQVSSLPNSSSASNPSTSNQYCMHSLASSSTTDSEIMKEPLKIAEQPEQNVTPSSSNNSVDRGRKRRECKAKVDALELEQAEEK
uniref:Uncharacterized protein n=1 Tax=Meloidogyne javanica TaxID=6303 RepID=A0A915MNK9_MELJA